jgi:hypothetical protein
MTAVADFGFRLFDRPLHPELLDVISSRSVTRGSCSITVNVTPLGHHVEWKAGGVVAVELTGGPEQPVPARGQLIAYRFDADRSGDCPLARGLRYRVLSQVERLSPGDFEAVHAEWLSDGRHRGLLVARPTRRRGDLPSLSWLDVTPLVGGLAVTAIHTFPAECAIAKTQSLLEPRRVH